MTLEKKVIMLQHMMDGDDTEPGILEVYLELAAQKILNRMYPYKEDYEGLTVPDRYVMAQLNIAVYLLNKRGAEGQTRHIENGVSRTYQGAYVPPDLLCDIMPMVGIPR